METRDTMGERGTVHPAGGGRGPVDRFEMKLQMERSEEEQVEAAAVLYEKAIKQLFQSDAPSLPERPVSEEELEAISQELKLRQMCQDIAAHIMVDELEDELDDEDEEPRPRKKRREE